MALATLSIDMVAKLAELQAGMDKAGRIAEKTAGAIEARFQKMAAVASGVGEALAGAVSIAGLSALFRATVDGLDKLNDLSDATGASIENLSALEDVAARTGTSIDTVGDAIVKMNKFLSEAIKPGSEAAGALKRIGLDAKELSALDPAQALQKIAQALAGYANDGEKARLVQEIFGKSLKEVAPLLKDMAEAGELNAKVTREQAEEAEKFNKQMFAFTKNVQDAARAVTGEMLPALNKFFERTRGLSKAGGFLKFLGLEVDANVAADRLSVVVAEMESLQATFDRQGGTDLLKKRMAALREEADGLTKQALQASAALKGFANVGDPNGGGKSTRPGTEGGGGLRSRILAPAAVKPVKTAVVQAPRIELDEATKSALAAIDKTDVRKLAELQATLAKLLKIDEGATGDPSDPAVAQAIEAVRKAIADIGPEAKAAAEAQARLNAALGSTPSAQMAALADMARLLALELSRATDAEQVKMLNEALQQTGERMRDIGKGVAPVAAEVSEFARQAAANVQDALGDTLTQTLSGKFDNILSLWGDMLKRMASQAIAVQLSKYLLGDDFGKSGNLGGLVGAGLGALSGSFGGFFATGGRLGAGQWGIAGEAGAEIVHGPANITPMVGSSVTINQTINVGQGVSRGEVYAAAMQAKDAAKAEIMQTLYRTGRGAYA